MTRFQSRRSERFPMTVRWVTLCLALTWLVGCQSMMKGKTKAKDPFAEDKFSCGEPHTARSR